MNDIYLSRLNEISKYREFSKVKFRKWYHEDPEIRQHITTTDKYKLSVFNTVAFFDLRDDPIDNIYRSVIIDKKQKIVLSTQSTKQILCTIYEYSIGGKNFQDSINKLLKYKYRNCFSLGAILFFSKRGVSAGSDWVSLHHVKDVKFDHKKSKCDFYTIKFGADLDHDLIITFNGIKRCLSTRLKESLNHNQTVRNILKHQLEEHMNMKCLPRDTHVSKTLLFNDDWVNSSEYSCQLAQISNRILKQFIVRACDLLNLEFSMTESDHKFIFRYVFRTHKDH